MLKKSKLFVIAIAFVAVFAVASVASAADLGSSTLRKGSSGPYVVTLQTLLGVSADGAFGPMTEAAVKAWQASHGLVADGIVGPATKAAMNSASGVTPPPASGCQAGWVVNPMTGASCVTTQLPAGCMPGYLFSPTTGAKCVAGTPTPGLSGDAGELLYSSTTTGLKSDVKEGATEKVLATKLEADGSDIEVKNVKVSFENNSGKGSTRLFKYVDEVMVMLGDEEVASVDADTFSKSGNVYSKSIALSGAVVKDGEKANLYVAVSTLSTVDDETATFDGIITQVRWADGTGALFSDVDASGSEFKSGAVKTFGFDEASVDDKITIKSSSANPVATTLLVDADDNSDEYLVGAFKLEVDDDSSDVEVSEFPILVTFTASGNTTDDANVNDPDSIIDEVRVVIDGEDFTASLEDDDELTNGAGYAIYMVDDEFTVEAGDTIDVKIYITFNSQEDYYGSGMKVAVSTKDTITVTAPDYSWSAEGEDELAVTGIFTGKAHTLSIDDATVSGYTWSVNSAGTMIDFTFTVEAGDEDFDVTDEDILFTVEKSSGATVSAALLTKTTGDAIDNGSEDFTVESGQDATFRARFSVTGNNGEWAEVTITSVAGQTVPTNKQVSPTATRNVNS